MKHKHKMNKADRQIVYLKMGGRCAYCGVKLKKGWHLDHIKPLWRDNPTVNEKYRGEDTVDNALPSCARCNRWKSAHSLERFREEIGKQVERLRRDSAPFRMAEDFGLVEQTHEAVNFYFECVIKTGLVVDKIIMRHISCKGCMFDKKNVGICKQCIDFDRYEKRTNTTGGSK